MTIDEVREYVEKVVTGSLPDEERYPSNVAEAMNYAMEAGGKRLRPLLMYLTFMAYNSSQEEVQSPEPGRRLRVLEAFMAAIEMIHTHSLIHDDLPALDNDAIRRGKPAVHIQFGESAAVLAGDCLLNYAYETIDSAILDDTFVFADDLSQPAEDEADSYIVKMMDDYVWKTCVSQARYLLSTNTGINGMLGGQSLDVELSGQKISDNEMDYIYRNKTCALIEAPILVGYTLSGYVGTPGYSKMIGGKEYKSIDALLAKAGEDIGLAFQVQDDILDKTGDASKLGKEVHQDEKNDKNTFVDRMGMEKSLKYVRKKTDEAVYILNEIVPENEYRDLLIELILSMVDREN